jgi:hypothetical protein
MRLYALLLVLCLPLALSAQASFVDKQYNWTLEKNIVYGSALNYLGQTQNLDLDLYKPLGDGQLNRPIAILIHGGVWLSGCKEAMSWLAIELAQRGYVVASINYRKGWHKAEYVPAPINPSVFEGGNCLYPADSLELLRAMYRGLQDVKGAIRWLKARSAQDSTCTETVLLGGESAGAFLALAAGFVDRPEEKPTACGLLPAVPPPGDNLSNCFTLNCAIQSFTPDAAALQRPDLGPVEGAMNLNGQNTSITGIISFFGGVPYPAISQNWLKGPDTPAVYLYHQSCDGIVPFASGKPFEPISTYCNLGFTPWHYNFPQVFGNGALASAFSSLGANAPVYTTDFLTCDPFNPILAFFECLRFSNNGSYHYPHNPPERAQKVAAFFNPLLLKDRQACLISNSTSGLDDQSLFQVSPNPFTDQFLISSRVEGPEMIQCHLYNALGQCVWRQEYEMAGASLPIQVKATLPPGLYQLSIAANGKRFNCSIIKEK